MGKSFWKRIIALFLMVAIALFVSLGVGGTLPAWASIDDDRLDGNVFVVYGGNGSLVPPKVSLAESFKREKPAVLVFYLDDSGDCKQFAVIVSRIQDYYGRAASIIPISVDALPVKSQYTPDEAGYYYQGVVPQTVIFDEKGKVVFDGKGLVDYETVDDVLRQVFNLLPRSESVPLKRRIVNEFSTELAQ